MSRTAPVWTRFASARQPVPSRHTSTGRSSVAFADRAGASFTRYSRRPPSQPIFSSCGSHASEVAATRAV